MCDSDRWRIVLNPSNVCLIQENGYVIYLKADTDVLYNRVKDSTIVRFYMVMMFEFTAIFINAKACMKIWRII